MKPNLASQNLQFATATCLCLSVLAPLDDCAVADSSGSLGLNDARGFDEIWPVSAHDHEHQTCTIPHRILPSYTALRTLYLVVAYVQLAPYRAVAPNLID